MGDNMAMSAQDRVKKYQAKCDAIMLRPKKEEGERIRAAAAAAGKSVQGYILDVLRETMRRDMEGGGE